MYQRGRYLLMLFLSFTIGCNFKNHRRIPDYVIADSINLEKEIGIAGFVAYQDKFIIRDNYDGSIKMITSQGKIVFEYSKKGKGPGEIDFPVELVVNANDLYLSDLGNRKMIKFELRDNSINFIDEFSVFVPVVDVDVIDDGIMFSTVHHSSKFHVIKRSAEIMEIKGISEQIPDCNQESWTGNICLFEIIERTMCILQIGDEDNLKLHFFELGENLNFHFIKSVKLNSSLYLYKGIYKIEGYYAIAYGFADEKTENLLMIDLYNRKGEFYEKRNCIIPGLTDDHFLSVVNNTIWVENTGKNDKVIYKLKIDD